MKLLPYGKEAIRKVKKEAPDLVLLDLRVPDINGEEAFNKMKEVGNKWKF